MVIFHGYVSLPEGKSPLSHQENPRSGIPHFCRHPRSLLGAWISMARVLSSCCDMDFRRSAAITCIKKHGSGDEMSPRLGEYISYIHIYIYIAYIYICHMISPFCWVMWKKWNMYNPSWSPSFAISSSDSTCKLSLIHRIYSEVVVSLRSIYIYYIYIL